MTSNPRGHEDNFRHPPTRKRPHRHDPRGRPAADSQGHDALVLHPDRFEEFSRSQKDVARYIVDHLEEAAFQTAEELARRADTSSSTVVRFSQALGFDGFPELQEAARDEYKRRSHAPGAASGKDPSPRC